MMRSRSFALAALVSAALAASACKHADDPLEPFRKQCSDLQAQGQLRQGLTLEACAKTMKESSDASDPAKRAEELAVRMQSLAQQKSGPAQEDLRIAISEVEALGKPAAPVLQSHLQASRDPDLRIAYAKALVDICFDDCSQQKYDCIVPALLEGTGPDKPAEVRKASVDGLARCTGKEYGDDLAAWTNWWGSVKAHP